MARFVEPGMTPASGVMQIAQHKGALEGALDALAARAERQPAQTRSSEDQLVSQVRQRGKNLLETWETLVKSSEEEPVKRRYSKFDKEKSGGAPILHQLLDENAPDRNSPEGRFCAPTSMRDVEETAHLWVVKFLGPFEGKSGRGGDG
jgi:hypothetical protein